MDDEALAEIVDELVRVRTTRSPIALLTRRFPSMTVDNSYQVQTLWRQQLERQGRTVIGHKIGLTSRAMQLATGISEPDYGVILDDMLVENGASVACNQYAHPRIEAELVFKLKADIEGPGTSIFDVLAATEYVAPALEILDSRIEMDGRTIVDTIADNAAMAAMVVGGAPARPLDADLRWAGAIVYRNQVVEETGLGAGVLNHPATGIAWLANRIARHGERLSAGEYVLAGSFIRPIWVYEGDVVFADYGPFGTVTCRFE